MEEPRSTLLPYHLNHYKDKVKTADMYRQCKSIINVTYLQHEKRQNNGDIVEATEIVSTKIWIYTIVSFIKKKRTIIMMKLFSSDMIYIYIHHRR